MLDQQRYSSENIEYQKLLSELFPFMAPDQSVIDGTYIIEDESYILKSGYHQTSSAILAVPRKDGRLIVPAVALNTDSPPLNLSFIFRDGLPLTHFRSRRWASWFGRIPLKSQPWNETVYTPQRGTIFQERINRILSIYSDGLNGKHMDMSELNALMEKAISGFWLTYYTKELPEKIASQKAGTVDEIENLFKNVSEDLEASEMAYENLNPHERLLLESGFNLTFHCDLSDKPNTYTARAYDRTVSSPNEPYRDPREIGSNTRGISADKIISVYVAEEILNSEVGGVAMDRLEALGIPSNKVHSKPVEKEYDHCLVRYNGGFDGHGLLKLVEEGKFRRL